MRSAAPLATPVVLSVTDRVGVTNARAAATRLHERRVSRRVREDVHQPARARRDRLVGALARADVDDGELAALLCGVDRRAEHGAVDGRDLHPVRRAVVVHDLDVVGALGDPRVDEGLRVGG